MGGKSSGPTPPSTIPPPPNNDAEMLAFMNQMMEMQAGLAAMQVPQLPPLPSIERDPIIDWAEKNEQLVAKARADYGIDKTRRKGRSDTILTSPILDDEDAETTGSLLA